MFSLLRLLEHRKWSLPILFSSFMSWSQAGAVVEPQTSRGHEETFPLPDFVARQVAFWDAVFSRFGDRSVLIHDAYYPEIILDLVDIDRIASRNYENSNANINANNGNNANNAVIARNRANRDRIAKRYLERYNIALKRFRAMGKDALRFGAIEKRVYTVYQRNPAALADLFAGRAQVRLQGGLADEFRRASDRARLYLPQMEQTFRAYKLPAELTRLAFVESMFNTGARSKVGASGIWQFMPKTARTYMYINHYIDERNNPLKATRGAAQLLAYNFQELRSWPLAITAYNHGRGGMGRAVKMLGTRDFGVIAKNYQSPTFGFASRNFYAEFVAAATVYRRIAAQVVNAKPIEPIQLVTIDRKVSVADILRLTPLDQATLAHYNPCLLPQAYGTYRNQTLPPYFQVAVPNNLAQRFKLAIKKIKAPRFAERTAM